MTPWPDWHLQGEPVSLAKYVLPREVETLVRLPGPSAASRLATLAQIYSRLVEKQIRYAYEEPTPAGPWQAVRSPRKVLDSPGVGNCLDITLVFAAACLVAGIPGLVAVIESPDALSRHALLVVDLMPGESPGPVSGIWDDVPEDVLGDLTHHVDGPPRRYCAVDAALCAEGARGVPGQADFAEAVASGYTQMTSPAWSWRVGVDLAVLWSQANTFQDTAAAVTGPSLRHTPLGHRWHFDGGQGKVHFQRSARGQRVLDVTQDFFSGRDALCTRARDYVLTRSGARKPLVVLGPPGSGKSCALSRVVMDLQDDDAHPYQGLAFHGLDSTFVDFLQALAGRLSTEADEGALHEAIASAPAAQLTVAVDALDEMRTGQDRESTARFLQQLSAYPQVRVVVATRSTATDPADVRPWQVSMAAQLHSGRVDDSLILHLDSPEFFNTADFVELIEQTLSRPALYASETSAAWAVYRADAALRRSLANLIVERAGRNYYVGTATAARLAGEPAVLDPNSEDFRAEVLPNGVDELFDAALLRLPSRQRERTLGLLSALAYGRGSGLSQQRWLGFATALGVESVTPDDLRVILDGPLTHFLVDRVKDEHRLVRLFHRSLVDLVKARRSSVDDEQRLCSWLSETWQRSDYAADTYVTRFLPSHVLAAHLGDTYLDDAAFVTFCDPSAVAPVARQALMSSHSPAAAAYLLALPYLSDAPGRNAQTLCLAALRQGQDQLAHALRRWADWGPWALIGEVSRPSKVAMAAFLNHRASTTALATVARDAGLGDLVVSCSADSTVRVWDPFEAGVPELACFVGHDGPVRAVTTLPWPGRSTPVVVTAGEDGTARIWDPQDLQSGELARFDGHDGPVRAVTTLPWPGRSTPVVVTAGEDGTARIWDPQDLQSGELARFDGHDGPVRAVTTLPWPGRSTPVVVTAGEDGTARIWDPQDPQSGELARYDDHTDWVGCVATGRSAAGVTLLATGSGDGTVLVRPLGQAGTAPPLSYDRHRGRIRHVGFVDWPGHAVAVMTSADDGTCAIWSIDGDAWPADDIEALAVFDGPSGGINATVRALRGADAVYVSASSDGVVHVWNPTTWASDDDPDAAGLHTGRVRASTVLTHQGQDLLIATGSNDTTARVWRARDGEVSCIGSFQDHTDWVRDVATVPWPGLNHGAVTSASGDTTVRIWDPLAPGRVLAVYAGHTAPVRSVRPIGGPTFSVPHLLTASADGTARIWNPYAQPAPDVAVLEHDEIVRCAVGLPSETGVTVATVCATDVWLWRIEPDGAVTSQTAHVGHAEMRDLATVRVGSESFIAAVGNDALVHLLDPQDGLRVVATGEGHRDWIWGAAATDTKDGQQLVTVSADGTLRRWMPGRGQLRETARLNLVSTGLSVRIFDQTMIVTTGKGFLIFRG